MSETVRERLHRQQLEIEDIQRRQARIRDELEEVKAQMRLFAIQLGWDADALEFPR